METCSQSLSCVWLCAPQRTIAYQAPLSREFPRQEYWRGLPLHSPGDLLKSGVGPRSPAFQENSLTLEPPGKPTFFVGLYCNLTFHLWRKAINSSFQFSSVSQSCLTLCEPMNCSMPGLPVHHLLPEFTQTHVHWVGDAIQPSHPLSSPSPPAPNLSQHQSLFQWVNSSHEMAKVLEFQL